MFFLRFFYFLLFAGVILGGGGLSSFAWAAGTEAAFETASLKPNGIDPEKQEVLPKILSQEDAVLYRRIFDIQKNGEWKSADRLIKKLKNRLLVGYVLAQRYLHPTKYRSKYKELKRWLARYGDHPDARRLYKLALRRKPKNWRMPKRPVRNYISGNSHNVAVPPRRSPAKRLSRQQRQEAKAYKQKINWWLRKGWTKAVKRLLLGGDVERLFSQVEFDEARARLGAAYFAAGRDEWALQWAAKAARRSGNFVSIAHWTAGLAAWRLKRFDVAAGHFETLAAIPGKSPWITSAAAFWAARTHLLNRNPEKVNRWLKVAAASPRTFYGLLSGRIMGMPMAFQWAAPALKKETLREVTATPTGRRTLALIQVGEMRRAERDLRGLAAKTKPQNLLGILSLACRANMPALAVRLNGILFPGGGGYAAAAYPLPSWVPADGFSVDRALIYAVIRQESGFNPKAKSWAGARGLMQLMPRTASFVARDSRFRGSKKRALFKPEVNLKLGQKYIRILLGDAKINGGLFLLAAAWNGGPGNLSKWRREINHMNDPLMFIESLPSRETRIFIERVFANLWIYRNRLEQEAPSLDAIAAGEWPVYIALDPKSLRVAENGQNRR
ncbi:MAG TPA: lytic transglycosylase domain-containing protein [Rhodospirillales bacterium]|jgi:soluble lytic murein transglycosylase-like protein|nr:lytic transglycosylase domain-containing protein [Rhodospirillales bacterium]